MLERLLQRLAEGGLVGYEELAQELGVSRALVEGMLEDLERMGYLRSQEGCSGSCQGCPLSAECRVRGGGRLWLLTGRGLARATKN